MNIKANERVTVFKLQKEEEKVITRVVSSYEGKNKDGKPMYSQWLARFVGQAYKEATRLREKDHIEILNGKIENVYNDKTKSSTPIITIFSFDYVKDTEDVPF